jgi:hypothetical protein
MFKNIKLYWGMFKLGLKKETARGIALEITQEDIDAARADADPSPERDAFADASVGDRYVIFSNVDYSTIVPRDDFLNDFEIDPAPDPTFMFRLKLAISSGQDSDRFTPCKMK